MSGTTTTPTTYDVAVIGCGLMGAALAKALAGAGHTVAAWNRTPERARAIAGGGVTAVPSIDEAVRSAGLVVACTSTYDTARAVLSTVTDWGDAPLVNLGSAAPHEVMAMARWAHERGIGYLDGAILCFPGQVGTAEGTVLYSGSASVWSAHLSTLMSLGASSAHIAEEVQAASAMDAAIIGSFYVSSMSAYLEGAGFALAMGVTADTLRSVTESVIGALRRATGQAVAAIENDSYGTDQATLGVYAEGSRHVLAGMRAAGHHPRLLAAAVEGLEAGEAAGLGDLGLYALAKVARQDAAS
ncbi:NAD(P)-binding domain-containing protein [Streptomyces lydicus]|uniref:NAD(P)-binding domain-containing protein n=1 Tax=Streptomyces lydicus TaxID=47763 RepID=UPI00379B34E6